jgi:hypothetical protein
MAQLKDSTINGNPVWHAGNDGTGSGLDADTLDGQHGSYYYSPGNPPPTNTISSLVVGTTAQRPSPAADGMIRYNTDIGGVEYYSQSRTAWIGVELFQATGGSVSTYTDGGITYRVHIFTSSGTFTVVTGIKTVNYLIVAGGGSGGVDSGGGGGAGGLITNSITASPNSYTIIVGGGGASRPGSADDGPGNNGGNSSAFGITALGGSGGSGWINTSLPPGSSSYSGGSGGGQSTSTGSVNTLGIGIGTAGQGNNGGAAVPSFSGGGGGRGSVGGNGSSGQLGFGGLGFTTNISGVSTTYSAGGDGGFDYAAGARSGAGSGRNGVTKQLIEAGESNSPPNTGHGGHGANHNDENSGGGGSGIVIIRYAI